MTARQIIVPGAMPSRDANGRALPAKLRFYEPDTALTTVATVYTSSALTVAHDFPILSDSAGRWPQMWADDAETFDVAWSDQVYDRRIDTFTDLSPADDAVLASVDLAEDASDRAEAAADAAEASALQAEAFLAEATGEPFRATSVTNLLIGAGSKSLTLQQTGKLFNPGQTVVIAYATLATTQMTGVVTAHNSETGALTVNVTATAGSGTYATWEISLSSPVVAGVESVAGETGAITADELKAALDIAPTDNIERAFTGADFTVREAAGTVHVETSGSLRIGGEAGAAATGLELDGPTAVEGNVFTVGGYRVPGVVIAAGTAFSAVTSVAIPLTQVPSGCRGWDIDIYDLTTDAVSNIDLDGTLSYDGAGSFKTGASDYAWQGGGVASAAASWGGDAADTRALMGDNVRSLSNKPITLKIRVLTPNSGANPTLVWTELMGWQNADTIPVWQTWRAFGLGGYGRATHLRLSASSGNLTGLYRVTALRGFGEA